MQIAPDYNIELREYKKRLLEILIQIVAISALLFVLMAFLTRGSFIDFFDAVSSGICALISLIILRVFNKMDAAVSILFTGVLLIGLTRFYLGFPVLCSLLHIPIAILLTYYFVSNKFLQIALGVYSITIVILSITILFFNKETYINNISLTSEFLYIFWTFPTIYVLNKCYFSNLETEIKRRETTTAMYQSIFENSHEGIFYHSLKYNKPLKGNETAFRIMGVNTEDEFMQLGLADIHHSNSLNLPAQEFFNHNIKKAKIKGRHTYRVNIKGQDDVVRKTLIHTVLDNSDPNHPRSINFIKDITKEYEAQYKLEEDKSLLQAVLENNPDSIWVTDLNRNIIAINRSAKDLFKLFFDVEVKIGTNMKKCEAEIYNSHPDQIEFWKQVYKKTKNGETLNFRSRFKTNDEKNLHFYNTIVAPIWGKNNSINSIIYVGRNITDLVFKENEITEKNKELQQYLESNIQLENFAYVASHDLKTPLRTILNFGNLLKEKKTEDLDEEGKLFVNFIIESSQRLDNLVDDMLAYSVIGTSGEIESINLQEIVQQCIEELTTPIHEKQAEVSASFLPKINGYRAEITSLFRNLLSNALKYSKPDTKPIIKIESKKNKHNWTISVSDNGIGFDPKLSKKIFTMFQRLENATHVSGTGIGLAHCKKIAELHNGKIWVESTPNKGSTFYFSIPVEITDKKYF